MLRSWISICLYTDSAIYRLYRLDPWLFVMEFAGCFNNPFAFSSHTCNWEMLSWPVVALCRHPLLHKFVEPPVFQLLWHDLMHLFAFQAALASRPLDIKCLTCVAKETRAKLSIYLGLDTVTCPHACMYVYVLHESRIIIQWEWFNEKMLSLHLCGVSMCQLSSCSERIGIE